jgi:hypothetical protein
LSFYPEIVTPAIEITESCSMAVVFEVANISLVEFTDAENSNLPLAEVISLESNSIRKECCDNKLQNCHFCEDFKKLNAHSFAFCQWVDKRALNFFFSFVLLIVVVNFFASANIRVMVQVRRVLDADNTVVSGHFFIGNHNL